MSRFRLSRHVRAGPNVREDGSPRTRGGRGRVKTWALLTVYQLLRMVMVTAIESRPNTDPDRASFTTALQAARDQLVTAAGIFRPDQRDFLGVIGRAVLNTPLPPRRARWSARRVKNATSRYLNRDDGQAEGRRDEDRLIGR